MQTFNSNDIYNEFSLQHELGIFLRNQYPCFTVQFERKVSSFFNPTSNFPKKEIDIVLESKNSNEKYAIELKYPRNGAIPQEMNHFIEDMDFMSKLKKAGFTKTYCIALVNDSDPQSHLFYSGEISSKTKNKHYGVFRLGKPYLSKKVTWNIGPTKDYHWYIIEF